MARTLLSLLLAGLLPVQALAQGAGAPVAPGLGPGLRGTPAPSLPGAALAAFEGSVEIQRSGEVRRDRVASAPVSLAVGDQVHTYRKGKATIRFREGSEVTLGPHSVFIVEEDQPGRISLRLMIGKLWANVSKLRGREFEVRTPVAVAAVRGTEFFVDVRSARESVIELFSGSLAVDHARGDGILLSPGQRVEVFTERLGRPETFEVPGRPEEEGDKKGEEKREDRREGRLDGSADERLKMALRREVGFQLGRDAVESAAAFEMKTALHQEGKVLTDAFGKRVRLEQYITRPDPRSFKFVTLNFRDSRLDFGTFEVTANKALPRDLAQAGNLWFSPTSTKPEFYAVKQRWTLSNARDSVTQVAVDGDSLRVDVPSRPIFDGDDIVGQSKQTAYQTVFGHTYEFLNGDPAQLQNIWDGVGPRPDDGLGMMWHARPMKMEVRDLADDSLLATYYENVFMTRDGLAGSTGKLHVDSFFNPNPGLAHFIEQRDYVDFQDTDASGYMNFAERITPGDLFGVAQVYHDKGALMRYAGGALVEDAPAANRGLHDAAGDTTFFSDRLGTGSPGGGNPTLLGVTNPSDIFAFARNNAREWQRAENFVIDDFGKVFDFRSAVGDLGSSGGKQEGQIADLFERLNFERSVTSSRFGGRKIDVVMSPRILMRSGILQPKGSGQGLPGSEPPGGP